MEYIGTELKEVIKIGKLFSIHYFEYMSDFSFEGEAHNFWEFLYVDKGEVEVIANDELFICRQGEIVFHKPNEFHALKANGVIAPNLVVISFECLSEVMNLLKNERMNVIGFEKKVMSQIIVEAKNAFSSPLDMTYLLQLERKDDALFGCEQMIRIHLEYLLMSLIRRKKEQNQVGHLFSRTGDIMNKENYDEYIYQRIIEFMNSHIMEVLTVEEICKSILVSRSKIQKIFNIRHNCGVMYYFNYLKIEQSKKYMREGQMNFTGIADYLGYKSIHYFSRQFKKMTNMTPSEYVASVKGMSEGPASL